MLFGQSIKPKYDYSTIDHLQSVLPLLAWLLHEEIRLGEAVGHSAIVEYLSFASELWLMQHDGQSLEGSYRSAHVLAPVAGTGPTDGKNWNRMRLLDRRALNPRISFFAGHGCGHRALVARRGDAIVGARGACCNRSPAVAGSPRGDRTVEGARKALAG